MSVLRGAADRADPLLPAGDLARPAVALQVPSVLLAVRGRRRAGATAYCEESSSPPGGCCAATPGATAASTSWTTRRSSSPDRTPSAMQDILSPLIDACQWILEFWHDLIGGSSWGWSIILLTFTVRIAILPLTFKGVKSMQRLQTLQPEIKKIQERYKDDRQRMNQEVMAFYQREKVNPLGSCLPLVLQIPFFISLFYLLRSPEFKADIAGNAALRPDRQPRGEGHRRAGAARRADRALRGHAARGERGHGDQRRPDAAADHVRAAVRLRDLHRQLRGGADRVLDHHERLDDRPAAGRQEALPEARA